MTNKLSPVTEIVNNTIDETIYLLNLNELISQKDVRFIVSTSIRASVEEILPVEYELVDGYLQYEKSNPIREQFLSIAEELEQ